MKNPPILAHLNDRPNLVNKKEMNIISELRGKFLAIVLLLNFQSCAWKTAHFWARDNERYIKYTMDVPRECTCIFTADENSRAKTYTFKDSSSIRLDDIIAPFGFPKEVYQKYGDNANFKFLGVDTLTLNGIDSLGKYWKIRKQKYAICSYWKVPSEHKQMFDSILNSIQFDVNKKYSVGNSELTKNKKSFEYIQIKCRTF